MSERALSRALSLAPILRHGEIVPGLCVALAIAVAASQFARLTSAPPVLLALCIGVACSGLGAAKAIAPGTAFGSKSLLRIAIVLLGARITFSEVTALGPGLVVVAVGSLAAALAIGVGLTRALGLDLGRGLIFSSATAICGASAALAIAAALPADKRREADSAAAIAGVTIVGSLAMMVYPIIARALGLNELAAGVLMGSSLHEVAQAIGAGYSISMDAGDAATAAKLLRVACLAPVALVVSCMFGGAAAPPLPWFVWGFVAVGVIASVLDIPEVAIHAATGASQWLLLVAIAALGLRTPFSALGAIGVKPLALLVLQSLAMFAIALGAIAVLRL